MYGQGRKDVHRVRNRGRAGSIAFSKAKPKIDNISSARQVSKRGCETVCAQLYIDDESDEVLAWTDAEVEPFPGIFPWEKARHR